MQKLELLRSLRETGQVFSQDLVHFVLKAKTSSEDAIAAKQKIEEQFKDASVSILSKNQLLPHHDSWLETNYLSIDLFLWSCKEGGDFILSLPCVKTKTLMVAKKCIISCDKDNKTIIWDEEVDQPIEIGQKLLQAFIGSKWNQSQNGSYDLGEYKFVSGVADSYKHYCLYFDIRQAQTAMKDFCDCYLVRQEERDPILLKNNQAVFCPSTASKKKDGQVIINNASLFSIDPLGAESLAQAQDYLSHDKKKTRGTSLIKMKINNIKSNNQWIVLDKSKDYQEWVDALGHFPSFVPKRIQISTKLQILLHHHLLHDDKKEEKDDSIIGAAFVFKKNNEPKRVVHMLLKPNQISSFECQRKSVVCWEAWESGTKVVFDSSEWQYLVMHEECKTFIVKQQDYEFFEKLGDLVPFNRWNPLNFSHKKRKIDFGEEETEENEIQVSQVPTRAIPPSLRKVTFLMNGYADKCNHFAQLWTRKAIEDENSAYWVIKDPCQPDCFMVVY